MRAIPHHITAIDMHVHLRDAVSVEMRGPSGAQISRHFGKQSEIIPVDALADIYRSQQMMAVLMNVTDEVRLGLHPVANDHIAEVVRAHPDVFLGFGIVDPRHGQMAVNEVRRCAEELGLVGIGEVNPARQGFAPNDSALYPTWEAAADLGLPVLFHGGFAAAGAGTRGGGGVKLKFARPILLDDLAADLPALTIICAHPSWPWETEALAVAMHKANVFIDLSGWAPKYLSDEVRTYVNSRISDKVLFGTDWPGLTPERWLKEFDELGMKPEVRQKVLLENALAVLKLERSG